MPYIRNTPLLYEKLLFIQKHSKHIQVSPTVLTAKNVQVQLPEFTDSSFTVLTTSLVDLVSKSESFELTDVLTYTYHLDISKEAIDITKSIKLYDVKYTIAAGDPILSLLVPRFKLLTSDDCTVAADSNGKCLVRSDGLVKTKIEFRDCKVINASTANVKVKVKAKDLSVVTGLNREVVLCFFESHLLAYVFEDKAQTVIQVPLLVGE